MKNLNHEAVGEKFSRDYFFEAREATLNLIETLNKQIEVGMKESEAKSIFAKLATHSKAERFWHQPQIRFGKNTLLPFGIPSEDQTLENGDIYFIDLGMVFNGHEGDIGRTFIAGENERLLKMKRFCEDLFERSVLKWKNENLTGEKLYQFVSAECENEGYRFVRDLSGHRLSDFPHYLKSRSSLMDFKEEPSEEKWVLEIQVTDPELNRGAFFEDLLM